jgi:hypothetical protein
MTNPTLRDSSARKVVAVARQIVTYQIGLPAGCQRMIRVWSPLLKDGLDYKSVFEEYMRQVTGLPIGSERLQWHRDALREKDRTLERMNREQRDRIFEACWALIDRLGVSAGKGEPSEG